jgi:DASH complex subunit DAD3
MASEVPEHLSASTSGLEANESLSPLEQEVLDEYARLLGNLNNVRLPYNLNISLSHTPTIFAHLLHALADASLSQMSTLLLDLSNNPSAAILDGLRGLERKTSLVFTLLKASVYSIVLNQQIGEDGDGERSEDGRSRGSVDGR